MELHTQIAAHSEEPQRDREDQKRPKAPAGYDFSIELAFTRAYRNHQHDHPAIREARCLQAQIPHILDRLRSGDLLAGRLDPALVGFSPDEWGSRAIGADNPLGDLGSADDAMKLEWLDRLHALGCTRCDLGYELCFRHC